MKPLLILDYLCDGFLNFTPYWGVAFVVLAVTGICVRRWQLAAAAALLAIPWLVLTWPEVRREPITTARVSPNTLKILLVNVSSDNHRFEPVLQLIRDQRPDLIGLIEIDTRWKKALQPALADYSVTAVWPDEGAFGLGVFARRSRLVLAEGQRVELGPTGVPSIQTRFKAGEKQLTVVLTHPYPPVSLENFRYRNRQLEDLSLYPPLQHRPFLLLGDLNTTPFSFHFRRLVKRLGAVDSRRGFGFQATWPTFFPVPIVPIDHVLTSPDVRVLKREIGPPVGSDHYPVILEVEL